jgi:hypothetical protein
MSSSVQNQLAGSVLDQFHVSIGLNLQNKLQDWPGRQQIQYDSMKGLMNKDWHGLQDFNDEMTMYSATHWILELAWSVIRNIVPNNPNILATLLQIPGFGQVGQSILSLVGIQNIIVAPQSILQNPTQLSSTIQSLE